MKNLKLNVINATSLGILVEIIEHLTIELMRKPIMLKRRKKEMVHVILAFASLIWAPQLTTHVIFFMLRFSIHKVIMFQVAIFCFSI